MRFFTALLASSSLCAVLALAAPEGSVQRWGTVKRSSEKVVRNDGCMTDEQAQQVANNFKELIAAYSDELANAVLTEDFVDYSDSVIELINNGCSNSPVVLGTATFSSRADFEAGQSAQPPIPFEQLNIWHTCDAVTLRWKSAGPGQEPQQVTGIIVMETECGGDGTRLINTVYSEFNSGAWMANLGIFTPTNCSAPA
ncbi:hypothetical protein TI39_contig315g00038 [Zymoseptoria brevis]|uniref:NTF2-like domain-containing protein n=1 Tax=Zymoseptoria brevis TaxID=1047168 RepID=A0A0F4GTD6_9PEZI|nr:hypothetical protein TI39_contig315g00038 [Zymoseptoria brevis]